MAADLPLEVGEEAGDGDPHPGRVLLVGGELREQRLAGGGIAVLPGAPRMAAIRTVSSLLSRQRATPAGTPSASRPARNSRIWAALAPRMATGSPAASTPKRNSASSPAASSSPSASIAQVIWSWPDTNRRSGRTAASPSSTSRSRTQRFSCSSCSRFPRRHGEAAGKLVDRLGGPDVAEPLGGVLARLGLGVALGERLGRPPDAGGPAAVPREEFEDHDPGPATRWSATFRMR